MAKEELKLSINDSLTAAPATPLTPADSAMAIAPKSKGVNWKKILGGKNPKSGELDIFKAIKFIYPFTILIIILILFWVMSFLYTNVYLTMSQAAIVSNLKSKIIEESVNFSKFNEIEKKITVKNSLSNWPYLNYLASPFAYGAKIPYPSNSSIPAVKQAATSTATSTPNKTSSINSTTTKSTSTKY
ncbi:MAG: hypothetical protein WCT26_03630 [Candidatus Buchananbacteria bacterium]|jgi:ATP-dependent Zn protease